MVLYTWKLYDVITNFQSVQDLSFLRIINSEQSAGKLLQYAIAIAISSSEGLSIFWHCTPFRLINWLCILNIQNNKEFANNT